MSVDLPGEAPGGVSVDLPGEAPGGDQIPRLDFELSTGCDHRCSHCYNVWTASKGDPQATFQRKSPLSTAATLALMTKAVAQSGAQHLTLTGGEPLLHRDAVRIIEHACSLVPSVVLITNGSHVTEDTAARLGAAGLSSVQLTLLAGDRDLHDRLKGAVCFDETTRAALRLSDAGVNVQVCYVAMRENIGQLRPVMELCAALGVRGLSYNRMAPTGRAIHHVARLMPTAADLEADLDIAEALGRQWNISVGTAMPVPPCLVRVERYRWIRFGFCSTGSYSPNIVIDPAGEVRSCNLSDTVLGNLADQDWAEVFANPYPRTFKSSVPDICRGCAFERSCQGGCKESARATFGNTSAPDPLVWLALDPEARAALSAMVPQHGGAHSTALPGGAHHGAAQPEGASE
jgi:radical SAM protein with 4Fe4S-binding SPASM domain